MMRLHRSVKATEKSSKDVAASALVHSPTPPARPSVTLVTSRSFSPLSHPSICDPLWAIRIVHNGSQIEGWLNGERLLEVTDATLTQAGGVGLWTKADAATSFDDFSVAFTDQ